MNEDKILGLNLPSPAGLWGGGGPADHGFGGGLTHEAGLLQAQAGVSCSDAMAAIGVMMMAAFAGSITAALKPVKGLYDTTEAAEQRIAETELRTNAYMAHIDPSDPGAVIIVRALARDEVMAELCGETIIDDEDY